MRAEEELQFMMDFYPELFPTRKHCLDHLFCSIGNGYDWHKGELVEKNEFHKRYRIVETIKKARPRNQQSYEIRLRIEEEIRKAKGDSYRITPNNVIYNFHWQTPSKDYSYLYNYPRNIKEDWLALLKECEQMLMEDGIIQDESQVEETCEEQSGGMEMG